jgi:hypothetical protein
MHGRWCGQCDLAGELRDAAQKHEFVERQRLQPFDLFHGVRGGELHLVAGIVAELERGRPDRKAIGTLDKASPV